MQTMFANGNTSWRPLTTLIHAKSVSKKKSHPSGFQHIFNHSGPSVGHTKKNVPHFSSTGHMRLHFSIVMISSQYCAIKIAIYNKQFRAELINPTGTYYIPVASVIVLLYFCEDANYLSTSPANVKCFGYDPKALHRRHVRRC